MIKIYYNSKLAKLILGKNYSTITLGKWVFTKSATLSQVAINEETTHALQWRDCFCLGLFVALIMACLKWWVPCLIWLGASPVFYYLVYLIMQLVELCRGILRGEWRAGIQSWNMKAYHRNSMEREAKENRHSNIYNKERVMFEFLKYL